MNKRINIYRDVWNKPAVFISKCLLVHITYKCVKGVLRTRIYYKKQAKLGVALSATFPDTTLYKTN